MLVWWQQAKSDYWSRYVRSAAPHKIIFILLALVLAPTVIAFALAAGVTLMPDAVILGA